MNNKERTQEAYNAISKSYYEEYKDDQTDLAYIDKFLSHCQSKILDLGCGMGQYSNYMKKQGYQVCGIDFAKEMLTLARKNYEGIDFIEADICNLPDTLEHDFDGVLLAFVLQHLSKEETKTVLKSLHKYITSSCNLLILFRNGEGEHLETEPFNPQFEYRIKEFSKSEITELLNECGYEVVEMEDKPSTEDEFSLCPTTTVLYARNKE